MDIEKEESSSDIPNPSFSLFRREIKQQLAVVTLLLLVIFAALNFYYVLPSPTITKQNLTVGNHDNASNVSVQDDASNVSAQDDNLKCVSYSRLPSVYNATEIVYSPDYRYAARAAGYLQTDSRDEDPRDYKFTPLRLKSLNVAMFDDFETAWLFDFGCDVKLYLIRTKFGDTTKIVLDYIRERSNGDGIQISYDRCDIRRKSPTYGYSYLPDVTGHHYKCDRTQAYYCNDDKNFKVALVLTNLEFEANRDVGPNQRSQEFQTKERNCNKL